MKQALTNSHYPAGISQLSREEIREAIRQALNEDFALEDATTLAIFDANDQSSAKIFTKQEAVLCGIELACEAFLQIDPEIELKVLASDGDTLTKNQTIIELHGKTQTILRGERVALNFLSFLSAISSATKPIAEKLSEYRITLLDTRKTIPLHRRFSKYATLCGGAQNHRLDLAQMGMIKDNHIGACGSISAAIQQFRRAFPLLPLEVEIDRFDQLDEVLDNDVNMILLDNMRGEELRKCTSHIKAYNQRSSKNVTSEASGGYNEGNIEGLKDSGVDYVSMSNITMNIAPIDFSLDIEGA